MAAQLIGAIKYFDCQQSVKILLNYEKMYIIKPCYYCKKC